MANQDETKEARTGSSMKLMIDAKTNRVVFAEASKEVVDFLFRFLALPVGTAACLLSGAAGQKGPAATGCTAALYESLKNFDPAYILNHENQVMHLRNFTAPLDRSSHLLSLPNSSPTTKFFTCKEAFYSNKLRAYRCPFPNFSDVEGTKCPDCQQPMRDCINYVGPNVQHEEEPGLVKGVAAYMVTDDLYVMPLSMCSVIEVLRKFGVPNISVLDVRTVELTMEKGLQLLNASFQSKTPLTDVFLGCQICRCSFKGSPIRDDH